MNTVMVIGDLIIDKYNEGTVHRVSPEAPVPVVKMDRSFIRLGGAANVANNIVSLGGKVVLAGVIGEDEAGRYLKEYSEKNGIDLSCVVTSSNYKTIEKLRVIGNNQQIVRMDFNDDQRLEDSDYKQLIGAIISHIEDVDVIVISDYAKGICNKPVCQTVIKEANKICKDVLVDPKGNDWTKYSNATLISPNLKEISEFLNEHVNNLDTEISKKCHSLYHILGIDYLLITRSEQGITLIDSEDIKVHIPSDIVNVSDVSGAGDTVIGTLACFWDRTKILDVIKIANRAAGIVVAKKGTAVVSIEELSERKNKSQDKILNKIIKLDQLSEIVHIWKKKGESVVFTNGCYDIFHRGHAYSIYKASEFGDHLIVALNSDSSVRKLKGDSRPINNEDDRAFVVASLECVEKVIIFNEDTPEDILKIIRPNVLVKGGDYLENEIIGHEYADVVKVVPYVNGYSTTQTINKMKNVKK